MSEPTPADIAEGHGLVRAFRSRNYRLYFSGQGVSMTGTWMQSTAMSWLAYRISGKASVLATIAFATQVPAFLMAPVAGAATDRFPRRLALIVTQVAAMIQAALLGWLTWSGRVAVWHLVALSAFAGAINAFDIVLRQVFVTQLVSDPADLANAIALNSSLTNATRFIGPCVAGFLIPLVGEAACFFMNAASFVAVIAALAALEIAPRPPGAKVKLSGDIAAGFRYAFSRPPIRAVLSLLSVMAFCGMPYMVLMPVFAGDVLHGDSHTLGYLMGATGLGALLAGLHLAARPGVDGLDKFVTRGAVVFGAALVAFTCSRVMPLSLLALVLAGYSMMVSATACNTIVQTLVDDTMRGRVMSLYLMAFMGLMPLGALAVGKLADHSSAPFALGLGGVACVLGGFLFGWRLEAALALPAPAPA